MKSHQFTWLNKQGVVSDHGFTVQFTGRFTCEYREGKTVLVIDVEEGIRDGQACIVIKQEQISLFDGQAQRQQEILQRLNDAMEF